MKYLATFFLMFVIQMIYSQTWNKDSMLLNDVEISATRLESYGVGSKIISISTTGSLAKNHVNIRQVLATQSGVNVRAYGISGLSSVSLRGTGSNHSAIFWEGVNLQSPTSGSLDLTLLPISFVDKVNLQLGASGALFGSGTLGGSIHLKSDKPIFFPKPISEISIDQQIGSFGQNYIGAIIGTSRTKYEFKIRVFKNKATNDFKFFNKFSNQDERQGNANIYQYGFLLEPSLKLPKGILQGKYWFQDNKVNIPKTASQGGKVDNIQKDKFHRMILTYSEKRKNNQIRIRSSWLNHQLKYNQTTPNISNSWISELQVDHKFDSKTRLQIGVNNTYETTKAQNYGAESPKRNQLALFTSFRKLFFERLEFAASAREVLINGKLTPFVPSLGIDIRVVRFYHLKGKVSRSFRIPTFNDLYWVSGTDTGNPNLNPEKGMSIELGQSLNINNFYTEVTLYSNYINDWIQWQPNAQGNWSPVNVMTVWTRGVELSSSYTVKITENIDISGKLNYTYTTATNEKASELRKPIEQEKSLIYVPIHQSAMSMKVNYKQAFLIFNHTYTGSQFTTSDNNPRWKLPAYGLLDVGIGYARFLGKHGITLVFKVNNIANKAYEIRRAYPMPSRNYNLNINYTFK